MKKQVFKTLGILSLLLIVAFRSGMGDEPKQPVARLESISAIPPLTQEDQTYIDTCVIERKKACEELKRSADCISLAGNKIPFLVTSIRDSAFQALFQVADSLRRAANCTHYITGLKITYGTSAQNSLMYLYEPVVLRRDSDYHAGSGHYGSYSVIESTASPHYLYDQAANRFVPDVTNSAASYALNYQSALRIRHVENNTTQSPIRTATDSTGDVRSLIFTFQEIKAILDDNNTGSLLYLWNVGINYRVAHLDSTFIKHSMLLGPYNVIDSAVLEGIFTDKYANRANLCPPDCNAIRYKLRE